jgi:hypothetical protein
VTRSRWPRSAGSSHRRRSCKRHCSTGGLTSEQLAALPVLLQSADLIGPERAVCKYGHTADPGTPGGYTPGVSPTSLPAIDYAALQPARNGVQLADRQAPPNRSANYRREPLAEQMALVKRPAADVLQAGAMAGALEYLPLLEQPEYLVRGWGHLVAGYPKIGKTELLAASVPGWLAEGLTIHWLTEESEAVWAVRLASMSGSLDGLYLTHALGADPRHLLAHAASGDEDIILVDTLRTLLGLSDECDNSAIARALVPWEARLQGRTRIYVHHDRKAGGEHGHGIAGGSAFLAVVDRALEIQFDTHSSRRRQITVYSRITQPAPLLYEQDPSGTLVAQGAPAALGLAEVQERLRGVLTMEWLKTKELQAALGEPQPSTEQVRQALMALAEGSDVERDPPLAESAERRTVRWRCLKSGKRSLAP